MYNDSNLVNKVDYVFPRFFHIIRVFPDLFIEASYILKWLCLRGTGDIQCQHVIPVLKAWAAWA